MTRRRSRASPGAVLLAVTLAGLTGCLLAVALAVFQPWLGLQLAADNGAGLRIVSLAAGSPAARQPELAAPGLRLLAISGQALQSEDLIEEPDFFSRYTDMAAFFERQSGIASRLAAPTVTLSVAQAGAAPGESTELNLQPAGHRPVAELPAMFWFQLGCGLAGLMIAAWIWTLRRNDWSARMFALTGVTCAMAAISAAVYSCRELAIDGTSFRLLSAINHTGTLSFGMALIAMFLNFPHRLVAPRWLLVIPVIFVPWLLADLLQLAPDLDLGLRVPIVLMLAVTIGCAALQWRRSAGDPHALAALRWVALTTILGSGLFIAAVVMTRLLGWLPPLDQSVAFGFLVLIYAGIALGLSRVRLFDLDRWAFRILLWVGGTLMLLAFDVILVLSLRLAPAVSLGLSVLVVGLLYLPLRNLLWDRIVDRRRLADDALFQGVLQVAFATSGDERVRAWHALLQRMFEPLEIVPIDDPGPAGALPRLRGEGVALQLPAAASSAPIELRYPWHGRKLFGTAQLRLATQVVALMQHADASRHAFERGVAQERQRVARDLHDDLGARLLTGLSQPSLGDTRRIIREAIAEMRSVVTGLDGGGRDLGSCLGQLRHETALRLENAGVELDWPLLDDAEGLQVDDRLCRNFGSMLRELVSNALRHADARRLSVSLALIDGWLFARICDDGVGGATAGGPDRRGLHNLRQRVDELGGRLDIRDAIPGTLVEIALPLSRRSEAASLDAGRNPRG